MEQDILFRTENFIFSCRVAAILIHDGKALLQRVEGDEEYAFIGGHVAYGETTEETLVREFREELHADIEVKRLCAVGEIFFPWGEKPCHQIGLFYRATLSGTPEIPLEGAFHGYDDFGRLRPGLEYSWVPLEDIRLKRAKLCLEELLPCMLEDTPEIRHFVSRQLENG